MIDLADCNIRANLAAAWTLPARWYTNPAILPLEKAKIFYRTWQWVGATSPVQRSFGISQMQSIERRDYAIDCNLKVYVDNYLEGYHIPIAHPGLFREIGYDQYRVDTYRCYSSQYASIRAAPDSGNMAQHGTAQSARGHTTRAAFR